MVRRVALAFVASFALWAPPVWAEPGPDPDALALEQAFDALKAGDFDRTVAKSQEIVTRFEGQRQADTRYTCASGGADTLTQLLGAAVANDKKRDKAITTTVAVSSNICDAYFLKGFALVDLGRRAEALPNLETAIAMDPDNSHYLNEVGEWYKIDHQWDKSLEYFTQASETTDLSLEFLDDKAEARRIKSERACRSYRGISYSQSELRHWDKARDALKKCLAINPKDPGSLQELDYIAEQSGKGR